MILWVYIDTIHAAACWIAGQPFGCEKVFRFFDVYFRGRCHYHLLFRHGKRRRRHNLKRLVTACAVSPALREPRKRGRAEQSAETINNI